MSNYTTNATTILQINGQQAELTLAQLRKNALRLETAIAKAAAAGNRTDLRRLRSELNHTRREIKSIESSTMQVDNVLRRLDRATPKELQKTLQTLNRQLEYMERGSKGWNEHVAKIKRVKAELAKVNMEMRSQEGFWARLNARTNEWMATIVMAGAAVTGLIAAARKAVSSYAEMEEELANTRKYTGMTEENVLKLNDAFMKMDTRTGREKLNELAQEAGRLGKNTLESVQGYVEAADIINVALVDLGDGATQTIAKIANIFGVEKQLGTKDAMLSIGSAVNVLSQNCTASKPYLVEFAQRMAGIGANAGMSVPEILAFGAVLDANGQKVEMSSTAIQKVLMKLANKNGEFARTLGMDAQKLNETLKHSAKDGLMLFLEQLHAIGEQGGYENATMTMAPAFAEMGLDAARVSMVLSTLAKHIDEVKAQMVNANKAFTEATSATREYNIFNNTVQAGLDKAKNHIHELAVQLGQKLLPVMQHVMRSTTAFMKLLNIIVDFIIEHKVAIVSLTAGIVAYNAAVALATLRTKAHALATTAVKVAQEAWIATQALATAAVSLFSGKVAAATQSFKIFSATLKAHPLGLFAAAVTAVVTAIVMLAKKTSEAAIAQKALGDIRERASEQVAEETTRLRVLIAVAQDENKALHDRKAACMELNKIIPGYNAQIDQTTGRYIASTAALQKYNDELQRKYELEGAEEQLKELGKQKASLSIELAQQENELKEAKAQSASDAKRTAGNFNYATTSGAMPSATFNMMTSNAGMVMDAERRRNSTREKLREVDAQEKAILGIYGDDLAKKQAPKPAKTVAEMNAEAGAAPNLVADESKNSAAGSKGESDKFKKEKQWKQREEALNRIAYAKGEKNYEQYTERIDAIAVEFYAKQLEHTDLSENERLTIDADYQEALKKQREDSAKISLEAVKNEYAEAIALEKQRFADGKVDHATYAQTLEQMELAHLKKMTQVTAAGSKERAEAEKKYLDKLVSDQQKRQKEAEDAAKKHADELKKIKDKVFGNNPAENRAAYEVALANLTEVYDAELTAAEDNASERLRIEEAFQQAKLELQRQYGQLAEVDARGALQKMADDYLQWMDSDGGRAVAGATESLISGMSSIFSGLSALIDAELEMQTLAIEKRYDRELSRAEGNSYKVAQLEKRKEEDIAKAKNEANRKMFAMQVIQAVAQTAQNALSAYGSAAAIPLVGYILAPIAAAMAVAAGSIQIAAIKKQQQASQAQGYAEGGFTPKGPKHEEVGVVHAGEWVASQKLLANPQARAIVNMLDYAQRTNTIGSIRQADVSRAITAPMAIASMRTPLDAIREASSQATPEPREGSATMQALSSSIARLNERLKEPFVTVNTVTGDAGIKKAQDDYEKLMKNKSPKSRR